MNRTPENGMDRGGGPPVEWLKIGQPLLDQLFADSGASSWGLSCGVFAATLELSTKKHFGGDISGIAKLEGYLSALHLKDLALACGCAEGNTAAWDYFVATYRGCLRSVAAFLLRCPPDSPAACELADSLFAELYGIGEVANRRSLFRYFHGRSSLKTWLRAVLAQRHVDSIRAGRRFEQLAENETSDGGPRTQHRPPVQPVDPHRERYVASFTRALQAALDHLDPQEKERLRL